MLSHFGSEHYCPLSLLRVYGSSMMEELEDHEIDGQDENDNSDGDPDVPVLPPEPGAKVDDEPKKPNLLERAADTVISLVKKITGNGHDKEKGSDAAEKDGDALEKGGDALDISDSSGETASNSESESQAESKNKIVTLVGHEELEENPAESKTINTSGTAVEQDPNDKSNANSQDRKSLSVNTSSEDSSPCEKVDNMKSNTTSAALTPCQSFAQVIGQYCLGCFMGRLLFSKKRYQDFTFLADVINSRKTKISNKTSPSPSDSKLTMEKESKAYENKERDDQEKISQQEVQATIQDKLHVSISESSVEKSTSPEEEKQQSSVSIPEPTSSSLEVSSEITVSSPSNAAETVDASSGIIVQPSQSMDSLVTQKSGTSDDQTPSLAQVSVVTASPLNSTHSLSSSSVTLQSSELPVFKESEVIAVIEESGIVNQQSIMKEPLAQQSVSQSTTSDSEPVPSVNKDISKQPVEPVELNGVPENEENKEDTTTDKISGSKEATPGATPTECKAPNSLHMMPNSSPDIDVLETTLTDKEGREGTAQLPEEVEKDPLPSLNGASQDKQVPDSQNVNMKSEDSENKETYPNLESQESSPDSTTSTISVEPQSVAPTIQPASLHIIDTDDLSDSVLPLPIPPLASVSSQEFAAASDANLDAALLSKAQQAAASSAGMSSVVGSGGHKESIFVRLSNKIKALEQNLNMSTKYMEQLNQRLVLAISYM